jgi:signal transduction histidine kinase
MRQHSDMPLGSEVPAVSDISTGADEAQALKATLDRLVRNAGMLLGVPSVSIALLEAETGDLVTWAALVKGSEPLRHTRFRPNEGVAGWVAAHLEPVVVNDVSTDTRFKPLGGARVGSMLCVPLIDDDHLLGTLTASSPQSGTFDARRQQYLQIFSDQAVLAISKTRQAQRAETQARELGALLEASRALTSSLDLEHVFDYIVGSIRRVIACDDAVIYAYDEHEEILQVVTGLGSHIHRLGSARVPLSDSRSIAAWVAKNRRARISTPVRGEVGEVTEVFLAGDTLAILCVPLLSKDRLRGVIMLGRGHAFQPGELSAMLNLSNIVAATLENAELYQMARAEHERQAAVYAAASDAIVLLDETLRIVEANDAFAQLASRRAQDLLGLSCCAALHAHDMPGCEQCRGGRVLLRAMESGEAITHIECEVHSTPERAFGAAQLGAQPAKRYIDFSATPVPGPQGQGMLLVGRDITALREMDQMKANFLSMISHELRSPLQTINGYLDLALAGMGGELTVKQSEFVRRARSGSEHLTALVDDLLLVSRRDAGQFVLTRQEIDLAPIIRETAEEMELLAHDASVRLRVEVPPALPSIYADGPRMAQVLRNLLTNAIKFTPSKGTVSIASTVTPDLLVLRVSDTGVGIAPKDLDRIFERFYQAQLTAIQGRAQGQGLGLAIVRIIVEGHGGQVTVRSAPHQGSEFTVTLPRTLAPDTLA